MTVQVLEGDALEVLRKLPDASCHAMVTDPPAGIAFMGRAWDSDKGGRAQWVAWLAEIMREARRVLKPGAHALVWALPRTSHWTATAIEDAGFEVRDVVVHLFGSGFPKSLDVSKAIDKAAGIWRGRAGAARSGNLAMAEPNYERTPKGAPATAAAAAWEGWGTALKPAAEHWILARVPLEGTVAANVLEHGCGGLNISACRIGGDRWGRDASRCDSCVEGAALATRLGTQDTGASTARNDAAPTLSGRARPPRAGTGKTGTGCFAGLSPEALGVHRAEHGSSSIAECGKERTAGECQTGTSSTTATESKPTTASKTCSSCGAPITTSTTAAGRWPSNVVLSGDAVAELDRQSGVQDGCRPPEGGIRPPEAQQKGRVDFKSGSAATYPVARGDPGGASRFFYCAKPSRAERGHDNHHATVKSIELMRWLVRLITPPGGTVLDPFAGSGTTGLACIAEGRFDAILIEREAEHAELALKRAQRESPLFWDAPA